MVEQTFVIRYINQVEGANEAVAAFNEVNGALKRIDKSSKKATDSIVRGLKGATKQAQRFKFEFLGLLFAGMALQRVFTKALRGIFKGMSEVLGEQHAFTIATESTRAAFGFLKFAIVDALSQSPLFAALIDFLIRIFSKLGELIGRFPGLATAIVTVLALGAAFGALLSIIGQVSLGLASVQLVLSGMGVTGVRSVGGLLAKVTGLSKLFAFILGLSFFKTLVAFLPKAKKAILFFLRSPLVRVIGAALAVLIAWGIFIKNMIKLAGGFKNAIFLVWNAIKFSFFAVIDSIINEFQNNIKNILRIVNKIRSKLGKAPIELTFTPSKRADKVLDEFTKQQPEIFERIPVGLTFGDAFKKLLSPSGFTEGFADAAPDIAQEVERDVVVGEQPGAGAQISIENNITVEAVPGVDSTKVAEMVQEQLDVANDRVTMEVTGSTSSSEGSN